LRSTPYGDSVAACSAFKPISSGSLPSNWMTIGVPAAVRQPFEHFRTQPFVGAARQHRAGDAHELRNGAVEAADAGEHVAQDEVRQPFHRREDQPAHASFTRPRCSFTWPRRTFVSTRRFCELRVGRVGRRTLRHVRRQFNQFAQPRQRVEAIAFEAAVRLCLDDDDTVGADALVAQLQQAHLDFLGQGRGADVEAQVDRVRNLVHVLPARALRANGDELDFAFVQDDGGIVCRHGLQPVKTAWKLRDAAAEITELGALSRTRRRYRNRRPQALQPAPASR
jgi:hypothetical protein